MPRAHDLTGQRFGRLTVICRDGSISGHSAWLCQCDCGNMTRTTACSLKSGHTMSCGCYAKKCAADRAKIAGAARGMQLVKHGGAGSRLYGIWKAMRDRCHNKNNRFYADYGGRGIKICMDWNDFSKFRGWALSHGYDEGAPFGECTLDRIDNDKGYAPGNCRWVNLKTQANNRRKRKDKQS